MKIPLTSGGAIDTDKLNDKDAELYEAINNFYTVCAKYNIPGFAKILLKGEEGLGALHLPNETEDIRNEEYTRMVSSISQWLEQTSDGRLVIMDVLAGEEPPQEPPIGQ